MKDTLFATALRGCLTGTSTALKLRLPPGYVLYAVVYHLEGGEPAQQFFREEQLTDAKKLGLHFEIDETRRTKIPKIGVLGEFTRPNVERIPDDDRIWLRGPSSAVDYILPIAEQSPKKHANPSPKKPVSPPPRSVSTEDSSSPFPSPEPHAQRRRAPSVSKPQVESEPADPDEIERLFLDTEPAQKRQLSQPPITRLTSHERASSSPSPLDCCVCFEKNPDSHDPYEVQCEQSMTPELEPEVDSVSNKGKHRRMWSAQSNPLNVGQVCMLPEAENRDDATIWFPAEFVDFDVPRKCQEYQFKWNESIAWSAGTPDDLCFYRAAKHWEHVEAFSLRLKDAQEVTDSTPAALDPLLAKIFKLAVNPVACLLVNLDTENEVIKSYSYYYKENSSDSAKNTFRWIECYHIPRNPALEAMLESPIEETARSKILKGALTGPETMKRVSAAGALLLQLLAVQHNLGETLNLNNDMFSRIKAGHLRTSTPASSKAMSAMAARAQPLNLKKMADVAKWVASFRAVYVSHRRSKKCPFWSEETVM
ncbi:hypothetical protein GGX14DRAFT_567138 [Mycena pura]|uniref:Uncharacterized protein n=1 Tax=Mycena pura TaxID=153505 RepID=A0AAD6YA12_9AGAR|nr:hypothetical protein GGX14DRAFT_567138 [Mycena pura]